MGGDVKRGRKEQGEGRRTVEKKEGSRGKRKGTEAREEGQIGNPLNRQK